MTEHPTKFENETPIHKTHAIATFIHSHSVLKRLKAPRSTKINAQNSIGHTNYKQRHKTEYTLTHPLSPLHTLYAVHPSPHPIIIPPQFLMEVLFIPDSFLHCFSNLTNNLSARFLAFWSLS